MIGVSGVTIGGTAAGAGNLISGNGGGVSLRGDDAIVQGNRIGTDVTGTLALGNVAGISVGQGDRITIGGVEEGAGNLISGNQSDGIWVGGGHPVIQGNRIGTDVTGRTALKNLHGVFIFSSANGMGATIGGTEPEAGNVISGNQDAAVWIAGSQVLVEGNLIGLDATGMGALANGSGVRIDGANDVTIGGTLAGSGNVISGNQGSGILVDAQVAAASDNRILGNLIGTDATGSYAVGNRGDGIDILYAQSNTVGGTVPGAGNVISGNAGNGLNLFLTDAVVQGNRIGVDASGLSPLGNGASGVLLLQGAFNSIGGTAPAAGNVIAYNGGDGVRVDGGTDNVIRGNAIYGHANGLGIALVHNGNNNQPAPVLTDAQFDHSGTTIAVALTSQANTTFALEFFSNSVCNPSGYGEGEVFLGTSTVTTDAAGNASFMVHFDARVGHRHYLAATATDPCGNTSAFSQCVVASKHGHQGGNTDRAEAAGSDVNAALGWQAGNHATVGGTIVLTDRNHESAYRDAVSGMAARGRNQAERLPDVDESQLTWYGCDLFFSGLGRDSVDVFPSGLAFVGLLDGGLGVGGQPLLNGGHVAMMP